MEEQKPVRSAALAATIGGTWVARRWRQYNTNKIRTAPPERRRFPVPR